MATGVEIVGLVLVVVAVGCLFGFWSAVLVAGLTAWWYGMSAGRD